MRGGNSRRLRRGGVDDDRLHRDWSGWRGWLGRRRRRCRSIPPPARAFHLGGQSRPGDATHRLSADRTRGSRGRLPPPAPDGNDPAVNVPFAWPSATVEVATEEVIATTGDIVSPPPVPVGETMLNATAAPPTGFPDASVTEARRVDTFVVPPALGATTLGEACNVILAAAEAGAVKETIRVALTDGRAPS